MIPNKELQPLLTTLMQVNVSGQNCIMMGECLKYLQNLLAKYPDEATTKPNETT